MYFKVSTKYSNIINKNRNGDLVIIPLTNCSKRDKHVTLKNLGIDRNLYSTEESWNNALIKNLPYVMIYKLHVVDVNKATLKRKRTDEQVKLEKTIRNEQIANICTSELECAICTNMYIEPMILQCGHTFCKKCLNDAFKIGKKKCPLCNCKLNSIAYRNIVVEQAISQLSTALDDETVHERDKIISTILSKDEEQITDLNHMISQCDESKTKLLNIYERPWNDDEKLIFRAGFNAYNGKARKKYCQMIGLTESLVDTCTLHQLLIICDNLMIDSSKIVTQIDDKLYVSKRYRKLAIIWIKEFINDELNIKHL